MNFVYEISACIGASSFVVDHLETEVGTVAEDLCIAGLFEELGEVEGRFGYGCFNGAASRAAEAAVAAEKDFPYLGGLDVEHIVFNVELVDFGADRGIEITLFERTHDVAVFEGLCLDLRPAAEAARDCVCIVGAEREGRFSEMEQIVECLRVFNIAAAVATAVEDLNAPETLEPCVIGIALIRPDGVIVADEEALLVGSADQIVDTGDRVVAAVIDCGACFVQVVFGLPLCDIARIQNRADVGIPILGIQVQMIATDMVVAAGPVVVDCGLKGGDGKKVVIGQIALRNENLMVGKGNDGLSFFKKGLFGFLRGHSSVRNGGVHMQICFVESAAFGEKILFHSVELLSVAIIV